MTEKSVVIALLMTEKKWTKVLWLCNTILLVKSTTRKEGKKRHSRCSCEIGLDYNTHNKPCFIPTKKHPLHYMHCFGCWKNHYDHWVEERFCLHALTLRWATGQLQQGTIFMHWIYFFPMAKLSTRSWGISLFFFHWWCIYYVRWGDPSP